MVDVSGGGSSSTIAVELASPSEPSGGTDYVVNASDAGSLMLRAPAAPSTFLVRSGFVALLEPLAGGGAASSFAPDYQRVNYGLSIGVLTLDGSDFGDTYDFVDTGAPVLVNAGSGNDTFTFGAVFGEPQTAIAGTVAAGDDVAAAATADGYVSAGDSYATTINQGTGSDTFTINRVSASLVLDAPGGPSTYLVRSFGLTDAPVSIGGGGRGSLTVAGTSGEDNLVLTPAAVLGAGLNVGYSGLVSLVVDGNGGDEVFTAPGTAAGTVTRLDGGTSGSDTFNVAGDVIDPVQGVTLGGAAALSTPFAGPHDLSALVGELIIDGVAAATTPALAGAPALPSEIDGAVPAVAGAVANPLHVSTLNVFDDLSTGIQVGTLSATATAGQISGLATPGGIGYSGVDVVDVMLGFGHEHVHGAGHRAWFDHGDPGRRRHERPHRGRAAAARWRRSRRLPPRRRTPASTTRRRPI